MESWDDENFEPKLVAPVLITANKWEGEDEEDDVKESWEDEDEEQKQEEPAQEVMQIKPKKKNLAERIAEKERLKQEEYERRKKQIEDDDADEDEISPEERIRMQKESDLKAALETTFGGSNTCLNVDGMNPNSREDFIEFADSISNKVQPFSKHTEYPTFVETLVRSVCATMSSIDIKKIKNTLDNLYLEKQKIEKGDKSKKNKGKGKAKLKLDNENQYSAYVEDFEDYDDFM